MSDTGSQAELKRELVELGVNSRDWHLYTNYGYAMFLPLGQAWCDLECEDVRGLNEVAWLKLLQACEMDVLPPPELVRSIKHWRIPGDLLEVVPPLFVRTAWKAAVAAQYDDDGIDCFVETELIPLAQWFFISGGYRHIEPGQIKVGWNNLRRLRRESVLAEARKLGKDDWPPIVRRFQTGAFDMVALSYEDQLEVEGDAMQHCVATYAERCRYESIRIFSVMTRKTSKRVATLSLIEKKPGDWDIEQIKGPKNAAVDARVWEDADGLCRAMNQVSLHDLKTRQFLDFVHSLGASFSH